MQSLLEVIHLHATSVTIRSRLIGELLSIYAISHGTQDIWRPAEDVDNPQSRKTRNISLSRVASAAHVGDMTQWRLHSSYKVSR